MFNKTKKEIGDKIRNRKKTLGSLQLDDAFERHLDQDSTVYSLFWDKVLFNSKIEETKCISNEYENFPIKYNKITYKTRLHYYYSRGVKFKEDFDKILSIKSVKILKQYFREIEHKDEWVHLAYRKRVMARACELQVVQNDDFRHYLRRTGESELIYLNFADGYFGIGRDGKGLNHLGRILMDCRALLTQKENEGEEEELEEMKHKKKEMEFSRQEFSGMLGSALSYVSRNLENAKNMEAMGNMDFGQVTKGEATLKVMETIATMNRDENDELAEWNKEIEANWLDFRKQQSQQKTQNLNKNQVRDRAIDQKYLELQRSMEDRGREIE